MPAKNGPIASNSLQFAFCPTRANVGELLEPSAFDQWLAGTVEEARALMQLTPVETFAAGPVAPADVLVT